MATLQLSGLASGFDWKSFVDSVMETERAPITRLQVDKSKNTSKISVFDSLATKITELQTAAKALNSSTLFGARSAKLGASTAGWSTSASANTAVGSYTFAVSQLATAAKRVGTSDIGAGIASTNDVSGVTLSSMTTAQAVTAGEFSVNGAKVSIAVTDSLQEVFDKISTATGGAVTASYDAAQDKISLSSGSPIVLGASNDTSNFLSVAKLANNGSGSIQSNATLGAVSTTTPLASARLRTPLTAVDGDGKGSFTINGVAIDYNVNTDSLSSVLSKINASTAGVNAAYDSASDRVVFTNKTTGNLGLNLSETAGGFLGAVGLTAGTTEAGKNALFTVNGGSQITSTSNTFDASTHGITGLSLTAGSVASETVNVASDTSNMRTSIEAFITKYNAMQSYIEEQSKVTTTNGKVNAALMANNREVQSWASSFRKSAFEEVAGLSGTIKRLEHLGIDFATGTGAAQLVIKDGAKLDAALNSKPAEVASFFSNAGGFASKMDTFATTILGTGTASSGLINSQKNTLLGQNTSIDKQIADIERRLVQERSRLEAGFIAMERAQATISQMQQQLSQAFTAPKS